MHLLKPLEISTIFISGEHYVFSTQKRYENR